MTTTRKFVAWVIVDLVLLAIAGYVYYLIFAPYWSELRPTTFIPFLFVVALILAQWKRRYGPLWFALATFCVLLGNLFFPSVEPLAPVSLETQIILVGIAAMFSIIMGLSLYMMSRPSSMQGYWKWRIGGLLLMLITGLVFMAFLIFPVD